MTILTPTYTQQINGKLQGVPHVIAAHEPTKEGEAPVITTGLVADPNSASGFRAEAMQAPLKVALIGTAPSSRQLAPFNDPTWKIWGCSPGNMNVLPRVDLWFELHSNLLWPEHVSYGAPYIEWLKTQSFPVYMQDQKLVPRATPFPKDELVAEFGDAFFTSSFAWMMAFAMRVGAAEISLYGIDMASRDEYIRQRPGFYYFKHLAELRGIKVSAPHESDIMQSPPLYAYVDSTPFGRKIMARRQEVGGRVNQMIADRDRLVHQITYLQGAQEDLDYFESIWSGVSNDLGRLNYQLSVAQAENQRLKDTLARVLSAPAAPNPTPGVEPAIPPARAGAEPKKRKRAEARANG